MEVGEEEEVCLINSEQERSRRLPNSGTRSYVQQRHILRDSWDQHGCLPSLLGDGDKKIEPVYGEETNYSYWADLSSQGEQKSLVPAR
jgi:hypothetical protein